MEELFFKGKSLREMSASEARESVCRDLNGALELANTLLDDLSDNLEEINQCHGEVFFKKVLVGISNQSAVSILGKANSLQRKTNDIKNIIHTRRCKKINSKDCF